MLAYRVVERAYGIEQLVIIGSGPLRCRCGGDALRRTSLCAQTPGVLQQVAWIRRRVGQRTLDHLRRTGDLSAAQSYEAGAVPGGRELRKFGREPTTECLGGFQIAHLEESRHLLVARHGGRLSGGGHPASVALRAAGVKGSRLPRGRAPRGPRRHRPARPTASPPPRDLTRQRHTQSHGAGVSATTATLPNTPRTWARARVKPRPRSPAPRAARTAARRRSRARRSHRARRKPRQ
jgi:hypothetical protein